jgi:hypothetical protein
LFVLSVRVGDKNYRVSNETLDRLFGIDRWRRTNSAVLANEIRQHHRAGTLIIDRRRLRLPSLSEEAERRLRSEEDPAEILRWGVFYLASQLQAVTTELRALRQRLQFDESAATARLSRDPAEDT